jgi:putative acetyltransferase
MSLEIRAEAPADYAGIGELHVRAFHDRTTEATMVALLRQRPSYDPDLSLVALQDGRIVGHALFSRYCIRLLDSDVQAVNLAPIAVHPEAQRRGIGSALVEEGHMLARRKGAHVSFLLGHSTYYPRFGYVTGAFGSPKAIGLRDAQTSLLVQRSPVPSDAPALESMWAEDFAGVDFSLVAESLLGGWLSPVSHVEARVYFEGASLVGYARVRTGPKPSVLAFCSIGGSVARAMAADLAPFASEGAMPVHPASISASEFGESTSLAFSAAMACPLQVGPLDDYLSMVRSGSRPVGSVTWPSVFDLE